MICGCRKPPDPQAVHDKIALDIQQGDLNSALLAVNRASEQFAGKSESWDWRFRVLKAQILLSQSSPKEALSVLHNNLPPSLATTDVAVRKHKYEGIAHIYAQEFEESEKDFADAENLATSFQPQLLCEVLNSRGTLEVDQKKYAKAEATFKQALQLARRERNQREEASILGNSARLSTSQEHFDQAIDQNQAALDLSRTLGLQSQIATILGNLGWAYFQLGNFDNALLYYRQAQETSEKNSLTGYSAYWLTGIANVNYANHDHMSAERDFNKALEVGRKLDDKETITECLNELSRIALETGRVELAEKYDQEALELEDSGLDHFGRLESRLLSGRVEASKRNFVQAEAVFHTVMLEPSIETSLKWEAQARLAKLYDDEGLTQKAEFEYQKSIDTIESARASVIRDESRLTFLASGIEFYEDYLGFLIKHDRKDEALRIAELSRARTLAQGLAATTQVGSVPVRRIRPQRIAQKWKSTLLFFWIGQKQSYLWVITPLKTHCLKLPKASEIDPVLKSFREALLGPRDVLEAGNTDGKKLYEILVQPVIKLIPKGSRVILLPDANLYRLNFETLIVPEPKPHYWIEDVTLATASSLTLLDSSTSRTLARQKNLLLIGNTIPPSVEFSKLPQAPEEMRKVAQYFLAQNRRVLEGEQATPTGYIESNSGQFTYLHFVTHGIASHTRPLESAVILSNDGGSFKLYGREIIKHRLNAELVTISACNGSGTRAYSGEGLVGLSWAFLRAGAHNVIGALWEVSDSSTPKLMNELYGELAKGHDPASALRTAKLSLLHSQGVYRKPFYWAPFQLYTGS